MGVDYLEMSIPLDVETTPVTEAEAPAGTVSGDGPHFVFTHEDNNSFTALNRILAEDGKVSWALNDFTMNGVKYSKGTFVVDANSISLGSLNSIAAETRISMTEGVVRAQTKDLPKSRIALYRSWSASADMGWIMYIFDQFDFTYHLLTDAEVRAGELNERFDVIILPDQGASQIINGHRKGTMPPDYVGGITTEGVENLKSFVEDGGILVCNKGSTGLPIQQFDLPIKNILQNVKPDSFSCPGSILKMDYDTSHPVSFGMPEKGSAFFSRSQAYEIIEKKEDDENDSDKIKPKVVARYPKDAMLLSGWILGEDRIKGKPSILDVPFGDGKILLFGFNFHNRAQSQSTFKLLFNAIYYR